MNPKCKTYNRKKMVFVFSFCFLAVLVLVGRLVKLMIFESEYYQDLAEDLHERERSIKAARGKIVDASGTVLATNRTVCTISVVHSQIKDPERVIEVLCKELELPEETVRKRVEKRSSIERVQANVEKEVGQSALPDKNPTKNDPGTSQASSRDSSSGRCLRPTRPHLRKPELHFCSETAL